MHTYAVMGVNTALIQASLLSRARVYTIVPAKMEARIDVNKGNFKFDFLPVQGIDKIASALYVLFFVINHVQPRCEICYGSTNTISNSVETFAIARNVEDLSAARITPMIPAAVAAAPVSRERFSSSISAMASSLVGGVVRVIQ